MAWIYLTAAGLLEVVWSVALKQSQGFTRILPSAISLVGMIASVALLSVSMRTLPLGTAYVAWTGIGGVGAFLAGILILGEPANAQRIVAAGLILAGLVLMRNASH